MTEFGETTTVSWNDSLEAIEKCYELGWTDGLPVVPPTQERVAEFLQRAGRQAGEVVGEIRERRREITAGKVAANAVMAGCLPEHLPVVLAATEAMLDPVFNLVGPSSSMGGAAVLVIVNGPVAGQLNINSRNNLFGPGNRANATIGRSIRLILMNACAAVPGLFDRSVIGHPGKFSYCIAEADTQTHWTPLHVERGFSPDRSTVTVFASESPRAGASHRLSGCDSARHRRRGFFFGNEHVNVGLGGRPVGAPETRPGGGYHRRRQFPVDGLVQRPG